LLFLVAGLLKLTRGKILVDGEKVTEPNSQHAMVFQEDAVFA
jgi:ABC-type nitrate/sulfonate/bicarbonate transport system ATPase subunit